MKLQNFFRNLAKAHEFHVSDCLSERNLPDLVKKIAINPSFVTAILFIDNPVKLFFMEDSEILKAALMAEDITH